MLSSNPIRRYIRNGTLTQLRAFEAVARLGSFTRAAEELFIAQPTVSLHVRKLAETVGLPLFEQIGKRIQTTAAGHQLYDACREIFATLSAVEMRFEAMRGPKSGRLHIAAASSANHFIARMLVDFARMHPNVEMALHVHRRSELLERLSRNADDLYLLSNPPQQATIAKHCVFANPLVVCARADHPLARTPRIPFRRIATEPFVVREAGSATRAAVEHAFAEHDAQIRTRMVLSSEDGIKQAVQSGLGVSVLSRHGLDESRSDIVILDVEGFPLACYWYFVYPPGRPLALTAQAFIDFACAQAGDYEQQRAHEHEVAATCFRPHESAITREAAAEGSGRRSSAPSTEVGCGTVLKRAQRS